MFVRAQVISRGAGRSIVSAAAYRHRARMMDEQTGTSFIYRGGAGELKHEELALPDDVPEWLSTAIEGKSVTAASEALWNAVEAFETRADAQLARELIIALPEELTRAENIALVREFVRDNLTSKGMVADWVYHDKDGNPHIHLMTALRPLTEEGFGRKKVPVLGEDGEPLRVGTPDRPNGKIVYKLWAGDKETMKAWKIGWAETANRHLALATTFVLTGVPMPSRVSTVSRRSTLGRRRPHSLAKASRCISRRPISPAVRRWPTGYSPIQTFSSSSSAMSARPSTRRISPRRCIAMSTIPRISRTFTHG